MSEYDVMTVSEVLRLYELYEMIVEINDGHITAIKLEEA